MHGTMYLVGLLVHLAVIGWLIEPVLAWSSWLCVWLIDRLFNLQWLIDSFTLFIVLACFIGCSLYLCVCLLVCAFVCVLGPGYCFDPTSTILTAKDFPGTWTVSWCHWHGGELHEVVVNYLARERAVVVVIKISLWLPEAVICAET